MKLGAYLKMLMVISISRIKILKSDCTTASVPQTQASVVICHEPHSFLHFIQTLATPLVSFTFTTHKPAQASSKINYNRVKKC